MWKKRCLIRTALTQSDSVESDGTNLDLRTRWPKSSDLDLATHHTRVNTQQQAAVSHRAGLGCLLKTVTSSARAHLFEASAGSDA